MVKLRQKSLVPRPGQVNGVRSDRWDVMDMTVLAVEGKYQSQDWRVEFIPGKRALRGRWSTVKEGETERENVRKGRDRSGN